MPPSIGGSSLTPSARWLLDNREEFPQELFEKFSVVLLPDTQGYTKPETRDFQQAQKQKQILRDQMRWIRAQRSNFNIEMVLHMGDIVEGHWDDDCPPAPMSDIKEQWEWVSEAYRILDAHWEYQWPKRFWEPRIPYTVVSGNHDIRITNRYDRDFGSSLRKYFPPQRIDATSLYPHCPSCTESNWTTFSAKGLDFLILNLEIAPTEAVLCEAEKVIEKHHYHRVILVTHAYIDANGVRLEGFSEDGKNPLDGADGRELWDAFVKRHPRIFLVVAGHVNGSIHTVDTGDAGNEVHQILTDFQGQPNGGNGWLRVLTFYPNLDYIKSDVVSVLENVESLTGSYVAKGRYPADPSHEQHAFGFDYKMTDYPETFFEPVSQPHSLACEGLLSYRGHRNVPSVAVDAMGNKVVAWEDDSDGNGSYQILVRGFDPKGNVMFTRTVNEFAAGQQRNPRIVMSPRGDFAVVWEDDNDSDGIERRDPEDNDGYYQIHIRWFNFDTLESSEVEIVNEIGAHGESPDVAISDDGTNLHTVVVWREPRSDATGFEILSRKFFLYDYDHIESNSQKIVNTKIVGDHYSPRVAGDGKGNYVVVWEDDSDGNGKSQIYMRGFHSDGTQRFKQTTVNEIAEGQQQSPDVDMDRLGNYVVVWEDAESGDYEIRMRGYNPDGSVRFGQRAVRAISKGAQLHPEIAMEGEEGAFGVVWQDDRNDNGYWEIAAREFFEDGSPIADRFRVNQDSEGQQITPSIAIFQDGNNVHSLFVWDDDLWDAYHGTGLLSSF